MTELIKVTKTTHYVDAFHLATYLSEKLGREVEIIDSANDTDYAVTVEKATIHEYDWDTLTGFIEHGLISMDYGYHTIFIHCANEGWLEEGDYVIRVSW